MPKSYILPTFEAWALPLRNALLERLPVSFAFGKDLPAKLEVLPCAAAFAPAAELTLTIDGHPWRAYFENRVLLPLHPLENIRRELVAHGEQQYGYALLTCQNHPGRLLGTNSACI